MENNIRYAEVKMLPLDELNLFDGNRDVQNAHVQKMVNLIEDNGFADTIKVALIKGKYYILEGQHRFEALKILNTKKAPCSIIDWLGEDFEEIQKYIISLNSNNKNWSLYDYVKSWSEKKIPEYVHLRHQMIQFNKTLSNGVVATAFDGIPRTHQPLIKGKLSFINRATSDTIAEEFSELVTKYGKKKIPAQVLRNAGVKIIKSDTPYDDLRAFKKAVNSFLSSSDSPLPDGDESFGYWYQQTIPEFK